MGQALYRKHRPKKLSDVVGQEHITKTLEQALKTGRISHAYLFTGPRGVGKTSVARIWAHEINGLPYDDDANHLDIIEIDAASNRRIDEIRELRDKVYVAPTSAKYKVYIIDEVHMLTKEAFNALLKTLEEPPAHAVFILATTDAHKVPGTIVSRTQRFSFKPVDTAKVVGHLRELAEAEKISIDDEALQLLAEHGEGSFRDSISLLDQAGSHSQKLNAEAVRTLLGQPPQEAILKLSIDIHNAGAGQIIRQLNELYDQGFQATAIAKQLAQLVRHRLMEGQGTSYDARILTKLLEVPISHDPERFLEIILIEETLPQAGPVIAAKVAPIETATSQPMATPPASAPEAIVEEIVEELVIEAPGSAGAQEARPKAKKQATSVLDEASWPQVLAALKGHYNTLYGTVRMAQPTFNAPDELTLAFAFPFHQKRLNEARNRQILTDIIQELTGQAVTINCITDKAAKPVKPGIASEQPPIDTPAKAPTLSTISNIFGGAELLE